jgi:hypothetical protein
VWQRERPAQRYCEGRPGTGWDVDQAAHNPKVAGSNPAPATNRTAGVGPAECGAHPHPGSRAIGLQTKVPEASWRRSASVWAVDGSPTTMVERARSEHLLQDVLS